MMLLRPHRLWLGLLALALLLIATSTPLLNMAHQRQLAQLQQVRRDRIAAENALRQLQDDIAATERLGSQIDRTQADKVLATISRLRAAKILERRANDARLTDVAYTFSSENQVIIDTVGAGPQHLTFSHVTLSAKAATDIAAFKFIESLRRTLPGRLTLRSIKLERNGTDAALTAANISLNVVADWLSNGEQHSIEEPQP